jgi:hypothetical protein
MENLLTLYPTKCLVRDKAPNLTNEEGRAIDRRFVAASHCGSTGSVPVRSCGICGVQSGTGVGFLCVLRFPLPILIPPTAPYSFGAGTTDQIKGTQSQPHTKKPKKRLEDDDVLKDRAIAYLRGRWQKSMGKWWRWLRGANRRNSEKIVFKCHFVHHNLTWNQPDWPEALQWDASI